jgi:hypothetical protein
MTLRRWSLPNDLLRCSIAGMRPLGAQGREGLALWFGTLNEQGVAEVSHLVHPVGPGFNSTPLYLRLSMRAVGQLTDFADSQGVFLIGQIHSHPGDFVDLSELDIRQGFRFQDFLSVVCPHYAQREATTLSSCGIHVFDNADYRRMGGKEVDARLVISSGSLTAMQMEVQDD